MPIPVTKMNVDFFIDKKHAIEALGNDVDMFYVMLGNLEKMTMNHVMEQMVAAIDERDYPKIKHLAHSLKGACSYVRAGRLYYITYFIQQNYTKKNYE